MDPILPPTLFNILDLLASKSGPVMLDTLNRERRVTKKRFAEIGRVLEAFRVAYREQESLLPDADLKAFIACWETADLNGVNDFFQRYQPYKTFLSFLRTEEYIYVPPKNDIEARCRLSVQLKKNKIGLNVVAIDTFKWWGLVVGQVYYALNAGGQDIYWAGEKPDLDTFEESLFRCYAKIRPLDGFANIGKLADRVCRELHIVFIEFERLLIQLCRKGYSRYRLSTSLVRPSASKSLVQTLLPRSAAKQLALYHGGDPKWTDKRLMEDGITIGRRSVKMIKIQTEEIK